MKGRNGDGERKSQRADDRLQTTEAGGQRSEVGAQNIISNLELWIADFKGRSQESALRPFDGLRAGMLRA